MISLRRYPLVPTKQDPRQFPGRKIIRNPARMMTDSLNSFKESLDFASFGDL